VTGPVEYRAQLRAAYPRPPVERMATAWHVAYFILGLLSFGLFWLVWAVHAILYALLVSGPRWRAIKRYNKWVDESVNYYFPTKGATR